MKSVLILGGYGNFGKRIAELLTRQGIPVIIAGRNLQKAEALAARLAPKSVETAAFDIEQELAAKLEQLKPGVVIDTSGPFQGRDYSVAQTCIAHGVPYIDLADGREYVAGFGAIDEEARRAKTLAISGASTVPALTSAVLDNFTDEFDQIEELDFGIAPGQRAERGLATTRAILGYVGKRLKPCAGYPDRYGWQDLHSERYPGVGRRWMANCEIPDLDLLPPRYGLKSIRFSASMELPLIHFGIWGLSWLVRLGLPLDLAGYATPLLRMSNLFNSFGSADGGMHVVMRGNGRDAQPLTIRWHIVAFDGDGPFIPAAPSAVLAKKVLSGALDLKGAHPCVGLVSLNDYLAELTHLKVETFVEEIRDDSPESG